MAGDNLLKRWAIWVDGIGKAGNAVEYVPPVIEVLSEDYQAGDMDMPVPIDVGMAAMEATWSISGVDVATLALFGLVQGKSRTVSVRSTYTDRSGGSYELVEELGGMITKIERDTLDTGSQSGKNQKCTMKLDYYKVSRSGVVLLEIDPVNHVRSLGGVDALEAARALMKLG
jgi:hypothetical protein